MIDHKQPENSHKHVNVTQMQMLLGDKLVVYTKYYTTDIGIR